MTRFLQYFEEGVWWVECHLEARHARMMVMDGNFTEAKMRAFERVRE